VILSATLIKIADGSGFFDRVKGYAATHHFPGAKDVKKYTATHHFPGLQNVTPGVGEAADLARGAARNVASGAQSGYDRFTSGVGNAIGNAGWGLVGGGHAVASGLEQAGQRGADWAKVYGQKAQTAIRGGLDRAGKAIGDIIPPAPPQSPPEKVGFTLLKIAKQRSRWGRAVGTIGGAITGAALGPGIADELAAGAGSAYLAGKGHKVSPSLISAGIGARDLLQGVLPEEYKKYVPLYSIARVAAPAAIGAGVGYAGGSLIDR
jgi:hypothetical protein